MLKRQNKLLAIFFTFALLLGTDAVQAYARETVSFGPHQTKIEGSIKYSVIGRYLAHFDNFRGKITLDESSHQLQSVYLNIDAGSIKSNHPLYDRAARSRRLLNAARYPKIIFKSDKITREDSNYQVEGLLEMHGIIRRVIFPFRVEIIHDRMSNRRLMRLKGNWDINRKDFHIIWNRVLDHGGILVSDTFTVNWGITVYIK